MTGILSERGAQNGLRPLPHAGNYTNRRPCANPANTGCFPLTSRSRKF